MVLLELTVSSWPFVVVATVTRRNFASFIRDLKFKAVSWAFTFKLLGMVVAYVTVVARITIAVYRG